MEEKLVVAMNLKLKEAYVDIKQPQEESWWC